MEEEEDRGGPGSCLYVASRVVELLPVACLLLSLRSRRRCCQTKRPLRHAHSQEDRQTHAHQAKR